MMHLKKFSRHQGPQFVKHSYLGIFRPQVIQSTTENQFLTVRWENFTRSPLAICCFSFFKEVYSIPKILSMWRNKSCDFTYANVCVNAWIAQRTHMWLKSMRHYGSLQKILCTILENDTSWPTLELSLHTGVAEYQRTCI